MQLYVPACPGFMSVVVFTHIVCIHHWVSSGV